MVMVDDLGQVRNSCWLGALYRNKVRRRNQHHDETSCYSPTTHALQPVVGGTRLTATPDGMPGQAAAIHASEQLAPNAVVAAGASSSGNQGVVKQASRALSSIAPELGRSQRQMVADDVVDTEAGQDQLGALSDLAVERSSLVAFLEAIEDVVRIRPSKWMSLGATCRPLCRQYASTARCAWWWSERRLSAGLKQQVRAERWVKRGGVQNVLQFIVVAHSHVEDLLQQMP